MTVTETHSARRGAGEPGVPEVLRALSSAVARGHHLAVIAGEGAGLSRLYLEAARRDLAEHEGGEGRVFVLTATADRAQRCARAMYEDAIEGDLDVLAVTPASVPLVADAAEIIVSPPALLLAEIRSGRLSAGHVRTVVLDDVAALRPAWSAVEAILQGADAGARRIASTHARDETFDELVKQQLPRARTWPSELFAAEPGPAPKSRPVRIACRSTRGGRIERLAQLLHELASNEHVGRVAVFVADEGALPDVASALAVEGFQPASEEEPSGVQLIGPEDDAEASDAAVAFELPVDAASLERSLGETKRLFAIVDPRHERQLELLCERLTWSTKALGDPEPDQLGEDVEAFRARVRAAVEEHDLASATLLLGPLLEEQGEARVAAALAAMLRASGPDAEASADASAERAAGPTWTRVFVDVGRRDGAQPGDLVGAITGETGAAGAQIGKIDIRQGFSLVDIDSLVADRVVSELNGSRIKGRQVVARLDRDKR